MSSQLIVSPGPCLSSGETVHCLMFDVYIACLPAAAASVWFFGWRSLGIIFLGALSAKLAEMVFQIFFKVCRGRVRTLKELRPLYYSVLTNQNITVVDGSAVVTGVLLAFSLPPTVPLWMPVVGSCFAIVIGKHVFGGLGSNVFNPALAGRAFLLAAWPALMNTWVLPAAWAGSSAQVDALTAATPLTALKMEGVRTPVVDLLTGNCGGCLGETSAVALLLGAAYLLYKGTITWHIPGTYCATVVVLALLLGQDPVLHLFSGGLILGAFFMATDVVTSPAARPGQIIFGCGCGVLTMLIRWYGGYPEGVCYAILIMNALTPLIDRCTGRRYAEGEVRIPLLSRRLGR